MGLPIGLLDEAADIIEQVAGRIAADGWSVCPCGEEHGQSVSDTKVPGVMRSDAEFIRKIRAKGDA
ncbi:hypothetical protein [Streptomyces sp. NPDC007172]|uniref:hypothetical protein n=1 Tax=Streptomyces sp. NPDC007172 TaxID=3364776 RepID=UPI0036A1B81C